MAYKANSSRPWPIVLVIAQAIVLALLLTGLATAAEAQNNGPIGVEADNAQHDTKRNASHLEGSVRITRGEMEVTADEGFAYRGDNGYERIELFGQPVRWRTLNEENRETTGHADQVIYSLTQRTVTLVGDAYIEDPRGTYSGQRLVYSLDTEGVQGEGGVRLSIEPEVIEGDKPDDPTGGPVDGPIDDPTDEEANNESEPG